MRILKMFFLTLFGLSCGLLTAQAAQFADPSQRWVESQPGSAIPVYRVTVIERTMKAINYQHRSGATKVDFRGTDLLPLANGQAKVESKQGYIEIKVKFDKLQPANRYGSEYLTYVLWAITPEGRPSNLGEVLLNGKKSKLNVSTKLQVFGLAVTAEPYFAVTMPSDLVVMENVVRKDTKGKIEEMDTKYELLQRGQYEPLANPLALKMDSKMPLELYQARNAVQIARASGAERYAPETFLKAENSLKEAEAYQVRKAGRKPVTRTARVAVQTAEDSRALAVLRQEEDRFAGERQAGAYREAQAKAETETEARLRARAESNRRIESDRRARAEAERDLAQSETATIQLKAEAARVAARTEADRVKRDNEAALDAARAEADRVKRDNDAMEDRFKREKSAARVTAWVEADRLKRENEAALDAARAEADRVKRDSEAARVAAQAEAEQAALTAAKAEAERTLRATQQAERLRLQAEAEKTELRAQLLQQFNVILETRDTARGLIVNMSDVVFGTAKYALQPGARERLAKVAGILLGHPGLRLEVEGHTDSVGGDAYNQRLSEQRAASVRDYLIEQGISGTNLSPVKGFGKSQPVATNDTAAGRQLNRRVELIVSGDLIGTQIALSERSR
jgi:outer membrane protein OmpA-like peptidoglycan-associated protein